MSVDISSACTLYILTDFFDTETEAEIDNGMLLFLAVTLKYVLI